MVQKYFIAIIPPKEIEIQITEIKQSIFLNYHTKGALRSPAHITLHMPFSWDDAKEDKLTQCLSTFNFTQQLTIELKNYSCFQPRVIFISVVENQQLNALQYQLVKHCKQQLQLFNQADDMRGFHPHITVAFRDLKKKQFDVIWEEYQIKHFDSEFFCNQICLLKQVDGRWIMYKEFDVINP